MTILALLNYRRDRPNLAISMGVSYEPAVPGVPQDSTLVVVVGNKGRRPVSIASVSRSSWGADHSRWKIRVITKWPFLRRLLRVPDVVWSATPTDPIEAPIVLHEAESRKFEFPVDTGTVERMKRHNEHDFVSVTDIFGREVREMTPVVSQVVSHDDGSVTIW